MWGGGGGDVSITPVTQVSDPTQETEDWSVAGTMGEQLEPGDTGAVSVTPPRHEPFVYDQTPLYTGLLQQSIQTVESALMDASDNRVPETCSGGEERAVTDNIEEDNNEDDEYYVGDEEENDDEGSDDVNKAEKTKKPRMTKKRRNEEIKAEKERKKRQFDLAIAAYKNGDFESYNSCAKHFGVNYSSLRRLILTDEEYVGTGAISKVFTAEEEQKLSDHLKRMSQIGCGYTHSDVQDAMQELLSSIVR